MPEIEEERVEFKKIKNAKLKNHFDKLNCADWVKGQLLGCGSNGSVYAGVTRDGLSFAAKEVSLDDDQGEKTKESICQLEQEIALLSQFEHENIVQYYGTQKNQCKLYIFLELMKESLLNRYQKHHLRDLQVSAFTRQILHGMLYLHDRHVIHRDIKCANILVDANECAKLADFGLAKVSALNNVFSCKGTPYWMAPEVVSSKNQGYGLAADIWSLGCTVLEMLTRQFPYSNFEPVSIRLRFVIFHYVLYSKHPFFNENLIG
ncbi:OLC1v1015435C1 [Oldenlandia corymbosa var. corymbosa]|uniref:mitogen-activated protein kinase kinase kinase n=1 Tax=Oldenlandia corymbosa var. corymbosa TaxID=529605 RepID=A0AAV1E5I2_OLDCO|nr:OLC1v1015435C1 [Oldenlandia corymbosa var. corymbosa]